MKEKNKGFYYYLTKKQIKEYSKWSIEKRLKWLYLGNLLRKFLPGEIKEIHEKFRKGEI